MTEPTAPTSFAGTPDEQLLAMLHHGDPALARQVAAGWERLSRALDDVAESVLGEHRILSTVWSGSAADHYAASIHALTAATRQVARTASAVRDLVHESADALHLAQRLFPAAGLQAPTRAEGDDLWQARSQGGRPRPRR